MNFSVFIADKSTVTMSALAFPTIPDIWNKEGMDIDQPIFMDNGIDNVQRSPDGVLISYGGRNTLVKLNGETAKFFTTMINGVVVFVVIVFQDDKPFSLHAFGPKEFFAKRYYTTSYDKWLKFSTPRVQRPQPQPQPQLEAAPRSPPKSTWDFKLFPISKEKLLKLEKMEGLVGSLTKFLYGEVGTNEGTVLRIIGAVEMDGRRFTIYIDISDSMTTIHRFEGEVYDKHVLVEGSELGYKHFHWNRYNIGSSIDKTKLDLRSVISYIRKNIGFMAFSNDE
jgi:hypothetical protein